MNELEKDFNLLCEISKLNKLLNLITEGKGFQTVFETRMVIAYLVKELTTRGEIKETSSSELAKELEVNERLIRETIQALVTKEFIVKYKKIRERTTKSSNEISFCTDKAIYSLLPTKKLLEFTVDAGYELHINYRTIEKINERYKNEMKKLETVIKIENDNTKLIEKLKEELQATNEKKEQVIILHRFLKQGNHLSINDIRDYELLEYTKLYDKLCIEPFRIQNNRASSKLNRITDTPNFK